MEFGGIPFNKTDDASSVGSFTIPTLGNRFPNPAKIRESDRYHLNLNDLENCQKNS